MPSKIFSPQNNSLTCPTCFFNFFSFHSQSAAQLSDDELPPDVDLNDPFFAEELEKSESPLTSRKKDGVKKKKKRKGEDVETEEDRRRKVK